MQLDPSLISRRSWKPPEHGISKVNTYAAFFDGKTGIGILVWNHLGTPFFARAIPYLLHFSVDYKLPSILEGYVTESSISGPLFVESDSLKTLIASTLMRKIFLSLELCHYISLIIPILLPLLFRMSIGLGITRPISLEKLLLSQMYLWHRQEIYLLM